MRFKELSNRDKGQYHCRGIKIDFVFKPVCGLRRVSRHLESGNFIKRINTPYKRSGGAHGNKRVHIRSAVDDCFKTAYEEFLIYHHYDRGKQKLRQPQSRRIFIQECGQRKIPHIMPH